MKTMTLLDGGGMARAAPHSNAVQRAPATRPYPRSVRDDVLVERNKLLEMQNRELQLTVRRLRQLAFVDGLTALANRRCFELTLRSEVRRASRTGSPLSLILCDADHFKPLNDTFGHQTGDAVLSMIGGVLRAHCRRAGDLAARYGGEEFALLLPGTALRDAIDMAERVRRSVEVLAVPAPDAAAGRTAITVSLGVTTSHSRTPCAPSCLINAADAALYRAKEAGRNRTRYQLTA